MSGIPGGGENGIGPVASIDSTEETSHVQIKVNGITINVTETVQVREVLVKAKDANAIEGSIDEYVIEKVNEEGEIKIEETIKVTELEEFIAVPTGKTDVA